MDCICVVFYHLTYEGAVDMDKVSDPIERAALEAQIAEFGMLNKIKCPFLPLC